MKVEALIGGVNLLTPEKEPESPTLSTWEGGQSFDAFMQQQMKEGRVLKDKDGFPLELHDR